MIENGVSRPPTVYPLAKGRTWRLLAGALTFVALSILFLIAHTSVRMVAAGVLGVSFFGLCAAVIALRLVRDRPELILDDTGLEHVTLGRFAWDEIAAVQIREQHVRRATQRFIELVLHDPNAYLARAPKFVRSTTTMNARLGFGPANIPTNTLPVPPEAVLDAMRHHRPGLLVSAGS